jgi:RimJ/RimL family protein N-acetyltransferase
MSFIEPIRTSRLVIRELRASDRDALLSIVREPEQIRHMLLFLETEEQLDEFLTKARNSALAERRLDYHLAVEDRESGQYLGSCCVMVESSEPSSAELGYWFLRENWGKGYATEACIAMLNLAFGELGFHRVWGKCHVRNAESAKVMEKLGMKYEGTLREHVWLRDHYRSSLIYGILAHEYVPANR